ncbi:ABC transporter related protein OS=Tsukamurella paurometabola (strain ATCC 8368 / DSM / CCUG 35730 / CIP 100753 / JCM 10117 / KCTC 9821 / NBRC 16120 / NCIMB 702349 / NCTC 13040) OX=521096 GN=Tpau_2322 PE=4 SV=1 [Tsukamurella paurometabola]|uniref:ABC transporter related protein n=1 Tax=Tsukamurella paurometabola (strain ATCC 8368 / DSM 20162 / CCUG 35730 / CIP 100753 / JCM 10117 / KCTC 9821 / NBRC 16120 / NCIMB 702349 / NCTC 13040) TaxID=521096 RepID=D5UQF9_TSUPD|nr:ABC transporter ATP-binding protein [Tsukamurella paurometabola]ADG78929.1 ABC transporter related protein [Tsukamurella paurometabola DSM 20162]SUP33538.1 Hemin import ATP-binding protein HmuV [Tsukamurella paurometabola]
MRVEYHGVDVAVGGARIIAGVSLTAESGEFIGVVGPNGSGKSTLLRCAYRVLTPNAGTVTVDDADVTAVSLAENARQVAAVMQHAPFDIGFTGREIVDTGRLPHRRRGVPPAVHEAAVDRALTAAGAAAFADRQFGTLSGGEAQRVLIARAFAQEPRVLVLDEPTNHLDVRHQFAVLSAARALGVTVIAVLHDLNLAAQYCDRLYVLDHGALACSGTPDEILTPQVIARHFGIGVHVVRHPRLHVPQVIFDETFHPAPRGK